MTIAYAATLASRPQKVAVSSHRLEAMVTPTIEAPMMAAYRYRDVGEHVAWHNAHCLGQVILLRHGQLPSLAID